MFFWSSKLVSQRCCIHHDWILPPGYIPLIDFSTIWQIDTTRVNVWLYACIILGVYFIFYIGSQDKIIKLSQCCIHHDGLAIYCHLAWCSQARHCCLIAGILRLALMSGLGGCRTRGTCVLLEWGRNRSTEAHIWQGVVRTTPCQMTGWVLV